MTAVVAFVAAVVGAVGGVLLGWRIRDGRPVTRPSGARCTPGMIRTHGRPPGISIECPHNEDAASCAVRCEEPRP